MTHIGDFMKTITISLFLILLFGFSALANDEMSIPVISRPDVLEEGTQTSLTHLQIAELLPWARDSKMFLKDLLDSIQGLSTRDKIEKLELGIKQIVSDSALKHSELLMRYILNRAIVLKNLINREMSESSVGTDDTKLRVLVMSINLATKYYDIDMKLLSKRVISDFQAFGEDYFIFLSELNKSIFDASAQYFIQRTSLEWLQWDLYRDLNNTRHAPKILKIRNALKFFPVGKLTDSQYLKNIQQLKRVTLQIGILTRENNAHSDNNQSKSFNEQCWLYVRDNGGSFSGILEINGVRCTFEIK